MDFKNFMHFAANSINPTDKSMKQAVYDQSFAPAVLGALNALRTMPDSQFPGTPSEKRAFQKKIFSEYYITIMYYLRNKIKRTDFREDSRSSIMDQTYMQDLRKQGIILEQADFGPSDTKPAHIHIWTDEKSEMNDRVISYFDQGRIDTIFESFMNARPSLFGSSTVMRRTKQATNKVSDDTFYDDYGA